MRTFIKNRDGGVCWICGKQKTKMACHHWKYPADKKYINDSSENIILLCQNCHKKHHEMLGGPTSNFASAKEAVLAHQDHYKMERFLHEKSTEVLSLREAKNNLWEAKKARELQRNQIKRYEHIVSLHESEHLNSLKVAASGGPAAYRIKEFLDLPLALLMIPFYLVWFPLSLLAGLLGCELPELSLFNSEEIHLPDDARPEKFTCLTTEDHKSYFYGYKRYGKVFPVTGIKLEIIEAYSDAASAFGENRVAKPPETT
ncbi:MAG: HNH endonuclease [Verrucomicrobia bacterium]|nr:HNH endonuclease [Verrucomicrobiota bacterium]